MRAKKASILFVVALVFLLTGVLMDRYSLMNKNGLPPKTGSEDTKSIPDWPEDFKVVQIPSSLDNSLQSAYFLAAGSAETKPLLVSLHTWSNGYAQADPLAKMALENGWNYIHPDFRGPNRSRSACLSPQVLSDVEDAIEYAIDSGSVDEKNIFVAGVSGGGYATLGVYLKTRHPVKAFLSWCPISDLVAWYWQSRQRKAGYADDILKCTSEDSVLNEKEAISRSPLYWDLPASPRGRLEIYAGIDDGYTGSVPVSHSILFFNRLAVHWGFPSMQVNDSLMISLLSRGPVKREGLSEIQGRTVLYSKNIPQVSLTLFDGGHEMLSDYCFARMMEMAGHTEK